MCLYVLSVLLKARKEVCTKLVIEGEGIYLWYDTYLSYHTSIFMHVLLINSASALPIEDV